jgi:Capsular polysaccharide synthesis protein/Sulfotransferase family
VPVSRSGCLFVHIPKCAGTSIEVALGVANEYPEIGLRVTSTRPHLAGLFGGGMQHLTIREIRQNFPEVAAQPGLFSFSIVRDPVDRFISHFLWKHHRFSDVLHNDVDLMPALSTEIEQLLEQSNSLDIFRAPFEGLEYCEGDIQTVSLIDIRRHLLPQCSYLFDRGSVPIDVIYPISAMNNLERDLQHRGAVVGTIPHRMVGKASKSLRQMIPENAKRLIQDVYRHDMRLYAKVREVSSRLSGGGCPGAAIDLNEVVDGTSVPPTRKVRDIRLASSVPRILWMYWHQGWNNAPAIVQKCAESWLKRNPSWVINFLTAENLDEAIKIPDFYKDKCEIPLPALSDVIRIHLLTQYGGVWADASTWCVRPLDEWLYKVTADTGFFAYALPAPGRPLSTWFIAASPQHQFMNLLRVAADELWQQVAENRIVLNVTDDPNSRDYFWAHRIFANLLLIDPTIEELWYRGPQIKADAPHYLQNVGLQNTLTPDVEFHIRNKLTNVYKLSRRIALPEAIEGTVLDALFKTL